VASKKILIRDLANFLDEATHRQAVTSKSFITRNKNILPLEVQSAIRIMDRHITETNYFVAWAERMREFSAVFADADVKTAIKQEFNNDLLKSIQETLNSLSTNGNKAGSLWKPVDFFRKNFTVGVLMAKPSLAAKQMVSVLAYLEKINPVSFTVGVVDFFQKS